MTFFDVRIPELMMTIVSADGNNVEPIIVDEFRIGVAETYDVIVEPKRDKAYALFAQALDRTGYALGSLTPSSNILASAPKMDSLPILTHADMGMNMKGMDMGAKDSKSDMAGMDMPKKELKKESAMAMTNKKMRKKIPITPLEEAQGVQTTMRVADPQYRLDDAGVGLRNNGRKVLTYADLKREFAPYVGFKWSKNFGNTADISPLDESYLLGGVRVWF